MRRRGPSGPPQSKSGKPKAKRMRRAVAFGEEENPVSRGPMWPVAKSGIRRRSGCDHRALPTREVRRAGARAACHAVARAGKEGEADSTNEPQRSENSAEPWPERPATQWQEREPKAKQMRPPGLNDQRGPLSRGPSGLPRSGKSGKNSRSTSVETTGHLSVRALQSRSRVLQGFA